MTGSAATLPASPADLAQMRCRPGAPIVAADELARLLRLLPQWRHDGVSLTREFRFGGFDETMGFVNALAWIARRHDHHPEMRVHYRHCVVVFTTHDAGGVTHNDVVCAAKAEMLVA